jgi:hypothetical protein
MSSGCSAAWESSQSVCAPTWLVSQELEEPESMRPVHRCHEGSAVVEMIIVLRSALAALPAALPLEDNAMIHEDHARMS